MLPETGDYGPESVRPERSGRNLGNQRRFISLKLTGREMKEAQPNREV